MQISSAIAQLRTTDLAASIRFYTTKVGLRLEFQYQDFYAGIRAGSQLFHLKLVDEKDPSIEFVDKGEHFHLYLRTDDAAATAACYVNVFSPVSSKRWLGYTFRRRNW
jgi:catechol 2,3-dioxygenase-like lactoylglutathione lyase family enzyme